MNQGISKLSKRQGSEVAAHGSVSGYIGLAQRNCVI